MRSSTRAFDTASSADRTRKGRGLVARLRNTRALAVPILAGVVILAAVVGAIAAPRITSHDPEVGDLRTRLQSPDWSPSDAGHVFGTDQLGRDVLSRLLYGSRITLLVGVLSVLLAGAIGVLLGLVSGYYGGKVDRAVSVVMDIQMSFPFLTLAIALVAVLGPGIRNIVIVLGISGWVLYSRIVRGEVLRLRGAEYVEAARAAGATNRRIMVRTILPNILAPVIVVATFAFAQVVIVEASLSFLGIGVQPPTPTWGGMLADGRQYLQLAWWLTFFPGIALMLLVLAINMLGDWLRDYLDPHLRV